MMGHPPVDIEGVRPWPDHLLPTLANTLVLGRLLALLLSLSYTLPLMLAYNKAEQTDWQLLRTEIDVLNEGSPYFIDHDLDYSEYRDGATYQCLKEQLYKEDYFNYQSFSMEQEKCLGIKTSTDLQVSYLDTSEAGIKRKIAAYIKVSAKYGDYPPFSVDSVYQMHLKKCAYFKSDENQNNRYMGPKIAGGQNYEVAR